MVGYVYEIDIVSVFSGIYGGLSLLLKALLKKSIVVFVRFFAL